MKPNCHFLEFMECTKITTTVNIATYLKIYLLVRRNLTTNKPDMNEYILDNKVYKYHLYFNANTFF